MEGEKKSLQDKDCLSFVNLLLYSILIEHLCESNILLGNRAQTEMNPNQMCRHLPHGSCTLFGEHMYTINKKKISEQHDF